MAKPTRNMAIQMRADYEDRPASVYADCMGLVHVPEEESVERIQLALAGAEAAGSLDGGIIVSIHPLDTDEDEGNGDTHMVHMVEWRGCGMESKAFRVKTQIGRWSRDRKVGLQVEPAPEPIAAGEAPATSVVDHFLERNPEIMSKYASPLPSARTVTSASSTGRTMTAGQSSMSVSPVSGDVNVSSNQESVKEKVRRMVDLAAKTRREQAKLEQAINDLCNEME